MIYVAFQMLEEVEKGKGDKNSTWTIMISSSNIYELIGRCCIVENVFVYSVKARVRARTHNGPGRMTKQKQFVEREGV